MLNGRMRERYWTIRSYLTLTTQLFRPSNRSFAHHVARDYWRFLSKAVVPIQGETQERAQAAVKWLLRAQDSTPDDGVSLGYFPCDPNQTAVGGARIRKRPATLFHHCLSFPSASKIQRFGGGLCEWPYGRQRFKCPPVRCKVGWFVVPEHQEPAVFNTGMVLQGYTAAYRATKAAEFLEAGRRAADFLLADMADDGHFRLMENS